MILILLASTSFAQETKKEDKAPIISMEQVSRSVMVIDPKARAHDFAGAFDALRKDKPTFKIMVQTAAGTFTGVTDLSILSGGTLVLIKFTTSQGSRMQVIPVEQIVEINYSP